MKRIPLSGVAASPFSRTASRCGKGDGTLAAGRPLLGAPRLMHAITNVAGSTCAVKF